MSNSSVSHSFSQSFQSPIDQIQAIVDDVERFMGDWVQRLDHLNMSPSQSDANLQSEMREFREQKSKWEAKRAREAEEIGIKADELTQAWLRLEQEQRRYLQSRESPSPANQAAPIKRLEDGEPHLEATSSRAVAAEMQEATVRVEATEVQPQPAMQNAASAETEESTSRRRSPLQGSRAGAVAARQFEQLRREIQSNRQPHRQV